LLPGKLKLSEAASHRAVRRPEPRFRLFGPIFWGVSKTV
jgi:hypothetical protein